MWAEGRSELMAFADGVELEGVTSKNGGQQGDPYLNLAFSYALKEAQKKFWVSIREGEDVDKGVCYWVADDGYAVGPPDTLYPALAQFQTDLADASLVCNGAKFEVYVSAPEYDSELRPAEMPLHGVTIDNVLHPGITIGGCPIGSPAYVQDVLTQKFNNIASDITSLTTTLRLVAPMALWTLLYHCQQRRAQHWMQFCPPDDVRPHLAMIDSALDEMMAASFGSRAHLEDNLIMLRIRSPVNEGGAGRRSLVDQCNAAYVGATWQIVSRLIDTQDEGLVSPGYHPDLTDIFGAGAFDPGRDGTNRFEKYCDGSCQSGMAYKAAYESMQAELPDDASRKAGPLGPSVEHSGYGYERGKGQRDLTRVRESPQRDYMRNRYDSLPNTDQRRIAFYAASGSQTANLLMTACPGGDFNFRPDEWHELMAWKFGLESLWLKDFVGCRLNNDPSRICDAYGMALNGGRAMGGSGITDRHDVVKWSLYEMLKSMNVFVKCEVTQFFIRFISAAGRDHLAAGVRERQGVVPDFTITDGDITKILDVKGAGLNKSRYIDAQPANATPLLGYAVQKRAKTVPREYERKAHQNIDVKFNGTAPGDVGPMEQCLKDHGGVVPLVFGHYGEICYEFDRLLQEAAETGAARLRDALYVKTAEQAKTVLLWKLRRKMAASIFRANLDCFQSQMEHLTGDAGSARRNHAFARKRFFARGDLSRTTYEYRQTHANLPGGQVGPW
eukprot:m.342991 g.342991  ORF g.342991 m.342991 type:complete len:727 (+) comp27865_c4_seq3:52-2232(+)